jgi:hypothetical protein
VNSIPTPDLSAFLDEVKKIGYDEHFRLHIVSFDDIKSVVTIKKNIQWFSTFEYVKDSREALGWKRIDHEVSDNGIKDANTV